MILIYNNNAVTTPAAYSGSLTAVFAAPAFERSIDTIEDAIKACEEDGYTLALRKDTSFDQLIRVSLLMLQSYRK